MTDIEEQTTEVTEEITEEEPAVSSPFLRITSTFPTDGDRVETLSLDLYLRDDDPVGDYDPDRPGEREAAKSWVLDLVVATIRELRGTGRPPAVKVSWSGDRVPAPLAGLVKHDPDCKGDCGLAEPPGGHEPLGHIGGDRKDAN
jgi:hypothetical protein